MNLQQALRSAISQHGRAALVTIESVEGSAPREAGAWMLVTPEGFHGTIGGGTLEWRAMAAAQKLLDENAIDTQRSYILGPDLGQCCGGRVKLRTRIIDRSSIEHFALPASPTQCPVFLFGAGHVGRALVLALASLPFAVSWIDPRPNAFPSVAPQNTKLLQLDHPSEFLTEAPTGSLVFVMTHSHALDLEIVDAALRIDTIPLVGLIGSATKRARFFSRLQSAGVSDVQLQKLICPIGIPGIKSKEPTAIAAATVAQILILDEALRQGITGERPIQISA